MKGTLLLRRGRLERDAVLLLAGQTFYKLTGVLLLAVLSRSLSARDIGICFFAESFADSLIVIASLQLNAVLMRRVAANPARASAHLAAILGFRLVSGLIYLCCVGVGAAILARAIWPVTMVVALSALMENASFSFGSFFIARRRANLSVLIGVPTQALFLSLFLLGMWRHPSILVFIGSDLCRSLGLLVAAAYVTRRWLGGLNFSWDGTLVREGMPFMLLMFLTMLRGKLDTVILGLLSGYDAVARYQLGLRIVVAAVFLPNVINQLLFAELSSQGLTVETRRTVLRGGASLLAFGVAATVVVFAGGESLIAILYGPHASGVMPLLPPFALLFPLSFLQFFLSSTMQALRAEVIALKFSAIGTVVGLVLSYTLILQLGALGAAYAQVVSAVLLVSVQSWWLWRRFTGQPIR